MSDLNTIVIYLVYSFRA